MKLKDIFAGQLDSATAQTLLAKKYGSETGRKATIQAQPIVIKDAADREFKVFIDAVTRHEGRIIVLGWSTSSAIGLELFQNGQAQTSKVTRHARGDVAEGLELPSGDTLGFSLISDVSKETAALDIKIQIPHAKPYQTGPLAETFSLTESHQALVPEILAGRIEALRLTQMGSEAWWDALAELPKSGTVPAGFHGFVEGIFVSPMGNGVVFGWALHPEDAIVWLEDELQNIYPLQTAFRRERRDIAEAFKTILWNDMEAAFIAHLPVIEKNPSIKLRAITETGVVTLSERAGAEMLPSDPRGVAEKLFAIETEARIFHRRADIIDWPILEPLISQYREELSKVAPRVSVFGTPPEAPEVSVIVPLYKRFDFMEHQILEFTRDTFFREKVELIYVIDDPDIRTAVLSEADQLFRLYNLPFKVISSLRNRGFSGANNLGADHASGTYLMFLNSDVIPIAPGWIERMLGVFNQEDIGAVGAQLMFPDGGVQHLGMDFEYLDYFQIWSNQHPGTGMPAHDTDAPAFEVPAVTGACILISKKLFAQINGWDTGYLIGDFEDSHFCFTIRDTGHRIMCQPAAVLTHLERQSFTGIGGDEFRMRMTICNAVRHQRIWNSFLESPATAPQTATDIEQEKF